MEPLQRLQQDRVPCTRPALVNAVAMPLRRLPSFAHALISGSARPICVRDLSSGGLFIEPPRSIPGATLVTLHFLVGEGQVRAEALVRHVERKNGLGLKFLTVTGGDRPKLEALLVRLQGLSRSSASQTRLSNHQPAASERS